MLDRNLSSRFAEMDRCAPLLLAEFAHLSDAHSEFQRSPTLKSISVSDAFPDGSIEATFNGVRIKFLPLLIFDAERRPRARVVCLHCHACYGAQAEAFLGEFSFNPDGDTDFAPDHEGRFPRISDSAPWIVLHFLELAMVANRTL